MRYNVTIAVYDTEENGRTKYTKRTYESLMDTVDHSETVIVFVNNNSCKETSEFLQGVAKENVYLLNQSKNLGTAEAVNIGWRSSKVDYYVKLDNDVVFNEAGWLTRMANCYAVDPYLGILGLKRKDLPNAPYSEQYPTELIMLDHEKGEPWSVVEKCHDIIGTCLMFSAEFLKEFGYLYQPGIYGYDDVLACERSILLGYYNAFLPSVDIDHIDEGGTAYIDEKCRIAEEYMPELQRIVSEYRSGNRALYYNPFV